MFEINDLHPNLCSNPLLFSNSLANLGGISMNTKEFIQEVSKLEKYHVELDPDHSDVFYVLNGPLNVNESLYYKFRFRTRDQRMDVMQPTDEGPFGNPESVIMYLGENKESHFSKNDRRLLELMYRYSQANDWDNPKKEWLDGEDKPKTKKEMDTKRFIKKVNGLDRYDAKPDDHDIDVIRILETGDEVISIDTGIGFVKFTSNYSSDKDNPNDRKLMKYLNKYIQNFDGWVTPEDSWFK